MRATESKHGHHHQSTDDRSQNADDAASKLQFLDWPFLDHVGRAANLLSAGVAWIIYGPEWPESFLLYRPFHRGKRDRVVRVTRCDIVCAPV